MVASGKVQRSIGQALLAAIVLVVLTFAAFEVHATLAIAVCLYVMFIVVLALAGNLVVSILASIAAVACINYYFTQPLFSFDVADPLDIVALALFVVISASIATLIARVRIRSTQLEAANALLVEQIAAREQAEKSLQQARDEAARVNRLMLVGEITASIAHEINQPLTGIIANAGTSLRYLAAPPPNLEEARTHLEFIVRDGNRAAGIISRVRALVKRAPPTRCMLDINEAILDVIALAQVQLQKIPIDLRTELARDLPHVPADRVQVQQVILNLLVNAVEAMRDTSGRREVVVASGAVDAENAFVEVRDSGPGFDPANLDRLFTAFYTTKPEGMGMGLSISRLIVEGHGGRLWGSSNVPHGAVFRFTLPMTYEEHVDA